MSTSKRQLERSAVAVNENTRIVAAKASWMASALAGLVCAGVLLVICLYSGFDIHAPIATGDNLFILSLTTTIEEGNWPWEHPRLNAPQGADWRDFPVYMWPEFAMLWIGSAFTDNPFLLLNIVWLLAICLTAILAVWSFSKLGIPCLLSSALGILFALQPFTFFRNTSHFNLNPLLVPLLCLVSIKLATGELGAGLGTNRGSRIPLYAWIAAILQGLSYIYNSFFACGLFLAGGGLGALRTRKAAPMAQAVTLVAVVVAASAVGLSPSLVMWLDEGTNAVMSYKTSAESERYGLKIRHLLTPTPEHPVLPVRRLAERMTGEFPGDEHENSTARLGTIASIGFLAAIAIAFFALAGVRLSKGVAAASSMNLVALLLSTVGGVGAIVALFAPQIRAYNRLVIFIAFFSLFIVGTLLAQLAKRSRWTGGMAFGLVIISFSDLLWTPQVVSNQRVARAVLDQQEFVSSIERSLPLGSAILALPYTGFPIDNVPGRMGAYDHALPYILSNSLHWSWGHILGRPSDRVLASVSNLPAEDLLSAAVEKDFAGIWLNLAGYTDSSFADQLSQLLNSRPKVSSSEQFLFFDIRDYAPQEKRFSEIPLEADVEEVPLRCYIDILNVLPTRDGPVLEVLGWAADKSLNAIPQPVTVRLQGDSVFEADGYRIEREDVAATLSPQLLRSGFSLRLSLRDVAPGKYAVQITQDDGTEPVRTAEVCDSGRVVEIPSAK